MNMEDVEVRLRELATRISNLKKFVTREFAEIISSRFLEIEEEIERLRREMREKLAGIEERMAQIEIDERENREYLQALEKLRKIDRRILEELD